MLIYNNTYTWQGPEIEQSLLWLISCRLWIIDLSLSNPDVLFMKSKIVVASDLNDGPKRKICAESLGKQIYTDFDLDIRRTLWIEYDPDLPAKLAVAVLNPKYHDGMELIYSIDWRKLMDFEVDIVKKYIPELKI